MRDLIRTDLIRGSLLESRHYRSRMAETQIATQQETTQVEAVPSSMASFPVVTSKCTSDSSLIVKHFDQAERFGVK